MIVKAKLFWYLQIELIVNEFQIGSFDSGEETPSYISNLEVKLTCGEGSARATVCENSKKLPLYKKPDFRVGFFWLFFKLFFIINLS